MLLLDNGENATFPYWSLWVSCEIKTFFFRIESTRTWANCTHISLIKRASDCSSQPGSKVPSGGPRLRRGSLVSSHCTKYEERYVEFWAGVRSICASASGQINAQKALTFLTLGTCLNMNQHGSLRLKWTPYTFPNRKSSQPTCTSIHRHSDGWVVCMWSEALVRVLSISIRREEAHLAN